MNVAVTLTAALLLGAGFVLQQHAAERAPKAFFLRLALITDLLRRRRWLAGLAVMIAGELASAWSVSHLTLSVAEPLLTTSLLFALALAVPLSGQRLRGTELIGALILGGGVAALSVARTASAPAESFGSPSGWFAAAVIAALACGFIQAGRRRSGVARATLTGTAAGLVFGISDALTRQTVHLMEAHPFAALLTSWPGYSLIAASLVGLWLMECAFNAAPLHASLPAVSAAEPAAGILLGVLVFGDAVRTSPAMIGAQAAGLVALVLGVVLVARAPALSVLRPVRRLPQTPRERASFQTAAQIISGPPAAIATSSSPGGP
jgi:drug/metabolite transporter (DMT)-like permease